MLLGVDSIKGFSRRCRLSVVDIRLFCCLFVVCMDYICSAGYYVEPPIFLLYLL